MPEILQTLFVDLAGLSAVSIFAAIFFATFVSEDAACIAAGALTANGDIDLGLAVSACFLGIVTGDILLYWVGRLFGRAILRTSIAARFVSEKQVDRATQWLNERGVSAIFLSRFITGLRLPTYLAAGFVRTDFRKFVLYFIIAAAIWTPLLVGSVAFSSELLSGRSIFAGVGVFVVVRIAVRLASWRNRRLMVGRVRRILHWEFWPLPVFYLPVVVWILYLGIRHRSLTVFTCANRSLPAGGFVGESKDAIYSLLAATRLNRDFLLPHRLLSRELPHGDRVAAALRFMEERNLFFPVIIKPDAGERGRGVRIVASRGELESVLHGSDRDLIIQQFFDGDEVSIFYIRHPGSDRGEIFSITEKVFPVVVGDGVSTLEVLILGDARAVCLAGKYFKENRDRLDEIPAAGEHVRMIGIGTHSRGAIFLDGERFRTPQLESVIDTICRRVDGFNFGRFDIRYRSIDSFLRGEDFKIIELNGVTSESTNIYDPRYSLIDAYRILFEQWRIAFEIGRENMQCGVRSSTLKELCQAISLASFA
jgi:membrane protein DedA with SNARE-associated domain